MPATAMLQDEDEYFTTVEASRISGASIRQLQFWDEKKVLCPSGGNNHHMRLWSADDVLSACVLVDLRRRGLSLQRARYALRRIETQRGRYAAVEYLKGKKGIPKVAVGQALHDVAEAASQWRRPVIFVDTHIQGKFEKIA